MSNIASVILFISLLTSAVSIPCRDDPFYTFGRYTVDGKNIVRTCDWIATNVEERKEEWCDKTVRQNLVKDKCPVTCEACDDPVISPDCVDSPIGWHDAIGPEFDCEYYAQGENCNLFGNGYSNFGKTANEACCKCGGGNADGCVDDETWYDSGGEIFDCVWYSQSSSRCEKFGDKFANNGTVANDVCCACGGGL